MTEELLDTVPSQVEIEIQGIRAFISEKHVSDFIPEMEISLEKAIGFSQRVGELANEAEHDYEVLHAECVTRLERLEEQTETTRKALLSGWLAEAKLKLSNLKVMRQSLKQIQMTLMQAIKTRREEPR